MPHVINVRLVKAMKEEGSSLAEWASRLNASEEEFRDRLDSDRALAFDVIDQICDASSISKDFVLFEISPMVVGENRKSKHEKKVTQEELFNLFLERLRLLLNCLTVSPTDVADTLRVSRTTLSNWKHRGQISEANLRKLCALDGADYEYIRSGDISTEAGLATHQRLFEANRNAIRAQVKELELTLAHLDEIEDRVVLRS